MNRPGTLRIRFLNLVEIDLANPLPALVRDAVDDARFAASRSGVETEDSTDGIDDIILQAARRMPAAVEVVPIDKRAVIGNQGPQDVLNVIVVPSTSSARPVWVSALPGREAQDNLCDAPGRQADADFATMRLTIVTGDPDERRGAVFLDSLKGYDDHVAPFLNLQVELHGRVDGERRRRDRGRDGPRPSSAVGVVAPSRRETVAVPAGPAAVCTVAIVPGCRR